MAVCENCHIAYSRLEGNIHRLKNEVREKEKMIDSFLSIAHAQSIHISQMQASVVLSPSSRLSQAAASDSADTLPWLSTTNAGADTLPWLSTTNAGAVPDPKTRG
ncbi:NAD(P)H-quinone oxidoreductase chain 4 [Dissostichus eleginoides]|uniref:NAD(P)H-quinone oxidoreductase chain 4 n=1 Tax=Dissostichus eleginoides TaxID=100907 RepID=A0AAD9ES09_DISEL|nr:NAD(P)H-quinone oxidoreductase chain 4 [Dissostichus eleginoides]